MVMTVGYDYRLKELQHLMNGIISHGGEVKFHGKGPLSSNILDFIMSTVTRQEPRHSQDCEYSTPRFMAHVFVVGNHAPSLHPPYVHIT